MTSMGGLRASIPASQGRSARRCAWPSSRRRWPRSAGELGIKGKDEQDGSGSVNGDQRPTGALRREGRGVPQLPGWLIDVRSSDLTPLYRDHP